MKPKQNPLKTIDWNTGLQARALFTMGANAYKAADEYEGALSKLLDLDEDSNYCGHLSDSMVNGDKGFDEAMKKQGFVIAKPMKRKTRR